MDLRKPTWMWMRNQIIQDQNQSMDDRFSFWVLCFVVGVTAGWPLTIRIPYSPAPPIPYLVITIVLYMAATWRLLVLNQVTTLHLQDFIPCLWISSRLRGTAMCISIKVIKIPRRLEVPWAMGIWAELRRYDQLRLSLHHHLVCHRPHPLERYRPAQVGILDQEQDLDNGQDRFQYPSNTLGWMGKQVAGGSARPSKQSRAK